MQKKRKTHGELSLDYLSGNSGDILKIETNFLSSLESLVCE
jgi:hypothetical protein